MKGWSISLPHWSPLLVLQLTKRYGNKGVLHTTLYLYNLIWRCSLLFKYDLYHLRFSRDEYLLLLAPCYTAVVRHRQVYLQGLDPGDSVCQSLQNIFCLSFNMKPFPFIRSTDVRSPWCRHIINNGTNVSLCNTSVTMPKKIGVYQLSSRVII